MVAGVSRVRLPSGSAASPPLLRVGHSGRRAASRGQPGPRPTGYRRHDPGAPVPAAHMGRPPARGILSPGKDHSQERSLRSRGGRVAAHHSGQRPFQARIRQLSRRTGAGENDDMTSDDTKTVWAGCLVALLDAGKPSDALGWYFRISPVVVQAAVGGGHWILGRHRRALAAWVTAAGLGTLAWGFATEAQTMAEVMLKLRQEHMENSGKMNLDAETTSKTDERAVACQARRGRLSWLERPLLRFAFPLAGIPLEVWWELRHPRRLSVLAGAAKAPACAYFTLRAGRAIQRRRPRMALGSAGIVAGSAAQLWAASAEPLG